MPADLTAAISAIDDANAADPNQVNGEGRALVEGRLADQWVHRLAEQPTAAVVIAARAHHLTRWAMPRSSHPAGRTGYLRWRREQKRRHADDIADILTAHGFDEPFIVRVQQLLRRDQLGTDPDVQLVEDAACLVFLEVQYDDMVERLEHDQLVAIVRKTLAKMSPSAIETSAVVDVSEAGRRILAEARG